MRLTGDGDGFQAPVNAEERKQQNAPHRCHGWGTVHERINMNATTVLPDRPIVKLPDDQYAGIGKHDQLFLQYRNSVTAVLSLDEAIKVAQMVLRYAERQGIAVSEASEDLFRLPSDVLEDEYEGFRPAAYIYGDVF